MSRTATRRNATRAERARRKFLRIFPGGFRDETYLDWERDYKVRTHERWEEALGRAEMRRLLSAGELEALESAEPARPPVRKAGPWCLSDRFGLESRCRGCRTGDRA